MVLKLSLDKPLARAGVGLAAAALCTWLGFLVLSHFIVGVLTDEGVIVRRQVLAAAAEYFPNSARLQIRLAAIGLSETGGDDPVSQQVKVSALRAVSLSPYNATAQLLLSKSLELSGEDAAAEDALRAAVLLAPRDTNLHWQFANLLVRREKLDEAYTEFRLALTADRSLLPAALELLWQVSGGDIKVLDGVTSGVPASQLGLAQFLLTQARANEAAGIFSQVDRRERLSSFLIGDSSAFIEKLMAGEEMELARQLWLDLLGSQEGKGPLLWNGGFESESVPGLGQFDWSLGRTEYAYIMIDQNVGRTGGHSLRVDFTGRDTTKLAEEIRQLVVLRPGVRYHLECYAKTTRLATPEGPRLVLASRNSTQPIAASNPVSADKSDWQQLQIDFVTPADQKAFYVSIQRIPKYSYDDPTRGSIWFDDFKLIERSDSTGPSVVAQKTMVQKER